MNDVRARANRVPVEDMVWVPGGTFLMGSDEHYVEERPQRSVEVTGMWFARTQVTTAQYAAFVDATGYLTVAERPLDPADFPGAPVENLRAGSMVFVATPGPVDLRHISQWWEWTPGAFWRFPEGPGSSVHGRENHPVVHIAYEDAEVYAAWAGMVLPTEAEWEHAARGSLEGARFTWGNEPETDMPQANYWHGQFPWRPDSGYGSTAAVASFPPNGLGLSDMAGNVWEWTSDWYQEFAQSPDQCCIPLDPRGGTQEASLDARQPQFTTPRKVVKGGSFLCADSYCLRYRPAARRAQMIDTGMSHIGFRVASRRDGPAA
jgi:sulfatase modifying factor 1